MRTRHVIPLASLGLSPGGAYRVADVLRPQQPSPFSASAFRVELPPHSVRVLKIIDASQPAAMPRLAIECPEASVSGQPVACAAAVQGGQPVVAYRWDFGDGTATPGGSATHTRIGSPAPTESASRQPPSMAHR